MTSTLQNGTPLPPTQLNITACATASPNAEPMPSANVTTIERHSPGIAADTVLHATLPNQVAMDHEPAEAANPPPEEVGPRLSAAEPIPVIPNLEPANPVPAMPDPAYLHQEPRPVEEFELIDRPQWPHHVVANGVAPVGKMEKYKKQVEGLVELRVIVPLLVTGGIGVMSAILKTRANGSAPQPSPQEIEENREQHGENHVTEAE